MSKLTRLPIFRIKEISAKIQHLEERIATATGKKKQHFKRELYGKKATLRHLCKLYVWGVQ